MNFTIIQIIISIILSTLILIQPDDPGMSRSITGTSHAHTRRGSEKLLFQLTIVSAVIFVLISISSLIFS